MTKESKVLARIRKLLNLAAEEGRGTEAERDLAMAKAQELMLEYDLSMAMVQEEDRDDAVDSFRQGDAIPTWQGTLLHRIAIASYVKAYYTSVYGKKGMGVWTLIGRPDHVRFVEELHRYLVQQLEGELLIAVKRYDKRAQYARKFALEMAEGRDVSDEELVRTAQEALEFTSGDDQLRLIATHCDIALNYAGEVRPFVKRGEIAPDIVSNLGVFKRSFFDAATTRIAFRLAEQKREYYERVDEAKGQELVRNEWAAVDKWMEEFGPKLGSASRSSRQHSHAGASEGNKAGSRADISVGRKVPGTTRQLTA